FLNQRKVEAVQFRANHQRICDPQNVSSFVGDNVSRRAELQWFTFNADVAHLLTPPPAVPAQTAAPGDQAWAAGSHSVTSAFPRRITWLRVEHPCASQS